MWRIESLILIKRSRLVIIVASRFFSRIGSLNWWWLEFLAISLKQCAGRLVLPAPNNIASLFFKILRQLTAWAYSMSLYIVSVLGQLIVTYCWPIDQTAFGLIVGAFIVIAVASPASLLIVIIILLSLIQHTSSALVVHLPNGFHTLLFIWLWATIPFIPCVRLEHLTRT